MARRGLKGPPPLSRAAAVSCSLFTSALAMADDPDNPRNVDLEQGKWRFHERSEEVGAEATAADTSFRSRSPKRRLDFGRGNRRRDEGGKGGSVEAFGFEIWDT